MKFTLTSILITLLGIASATPVMPSPNGSAGDLASQCHPFGMQFLAKYQPSDEVNALYCKYDS